ncbi:MAG: nucleotidyl transferase AbiEii/AbiGii toxin family protein [Oscillospiraceae bacterium]|nr:nucleotidyl transferase AbiEii/AbiGii toxin family protein [Oscillospiraceae bacterium]
MSEVLEQMLKGYQVENIYDRKNAMKEIMQEIVLCGLSRAGFFKEAAFYGGTALRIFYGLDRFSEDLDFSLMTVNPEFELAAYFPMLEKEVRSFGLNVTIQEKKKTKESNIRSAFLKGNTKEHLLLFYPNEQIAGGITNNEVVKIKFEVDVNPPKYATFEHKYRLLPAPYEVNLYDMPSLFAGKIHAVLCRAWQSRIKGRDLYDYVFYLTRGTSVNQKHLRERLLQSGFIVQESACSLEEIKTMLSERFDSIDYAQAKLDAEPFIRDTSSLDIWCADFFKQITEGLTVC